MKKRIFYAVVLSAGLVAGMAARAEDTGDTSGSASGANVTPSTAVQKDNTHLPDMTPSDLPGPSGMSAGAPGIESKKGTQSGKEWLPPEEIRKKRAM